jgi:hypothetical protein
VPHFLLIVFCLAVLHLHAGEAWFSANMAQGSVVYPVTVRVRVDTVVAYKGSHQLALHAVSGQTYQGLSLSFETQFRSTDTVFHMQSVGLFRTEGTFSPVWQNTVRSGLGEVEWTRRRFTEKPVRTEFHSLQLGDGQHTFEADAVPEEFLYMRAPALDSVHPHAELKILAPVWEQPYSTGAWTAVANYTGVRLRIEGVDCYQVVYARSDGATSEYFISARGRLVMRFKSFRGTWFSRVQ